MNNKQNTNRAPDEAIPKEPISAGVLAEHVRTGQYDWPGEQLQADRTLEFECQVFFHWRHFLLPPRVVSTPLHLSAPSFWEMKKASLTSHPKQPIGWKTDDSTCGWSLFLFRANFLFCFLSLFIRFGCTIKLSSDVLMLEF